MFPENTCVNCGRGMSREFTSCPESSSALLCTSYVPAALAKYIESQDTRIAELSTPLSYGHRKTELVRRYPETSLVFNVRTGKYCVNLRDNVRTAHCFPTEEQAFDAAFRLANI